MPADIIDCNCFPLAFIHLRIFRVAESVVALEVLQISSVISSEAEAGRLNEWNNGNISEQRTNLRGGGRHLEADDQAGGQLDREP